MAGSSIIELTCHHAVDIPKRFGILKQLGVAGGGRLKRCWILK